MEINEAWLAGFIEGDGCFSQNKSRGKAYPKIELHQKNIEPIDAVVRNFGFGKPYKYERKDSWLFSTRVNGRNAQAVFDLISPYLSDKRIEQATNRGLEYHGKKKAHDLSWFAGYYEAEGCIYTKTNGQVKRDGTKTLFVGMTISQYYSLQTSEFCRNALGFGRVAGPYLARGERRAYSFNLSGQQAIKTVESIKHMLSEEKHRQLEGVIYGSNRGASSS